MAAFNSSASTIVCPCPFRRKPRPVWKPRRYSDNLSRYLLTVTGLKAARYDLKIDGVAAGQFTREQLVTGVNLTNLPGTHHRANARPLQKDFGERGDFYDSLEKRADFAPKFPNWVDAPLTLDPASSEALEKGRKVELDRLDGLIADQEKDIDATRQPKPHTFLLEPATDPMGTKPPSRRSSPRGE